jgi:hypothetical protein
VKLFIFAPREGTFGKPLISSFDWVGRIAVTDCGVLDTALLTRRFDPGRMENPEFFFLLVSDLIDLLFSEEIDDGDRSPPDELAGDLFFPLDKKFL